jgi:hypothetical protein
MLKSNWKEHIENLEPWSVHPGVRLGEIDIEPVVGPGPELEVTALLVEGEPGDVDLAGGLEQAYRGESVDIARQNSWTKSIGNIQ